MSDSCWCVRHRAQAPPPPRGHRCRVVSQSFCRPIVFFVTFLFILFPRFFCVPLSHMAAAPSSSPLPGDPLLLVRAAHTCAPPSLVLSPPLTPTPPSRILFPPLPLHTPSTMTGRSYPRPPPHRPTQRNATRHDATQHDTTQRNATQRNTPQRNATQRNTTRRRINVFKVLSCSNRSAHDWKCCPFAHPGEHARRRPLDRFAYTAKLCAAARRGAPCARGDACGFAHHPYEAWLHPLRYKTQICGDGAACARRVRPRALSFVVYF